jgi:hypothetical protein
MFSLLAEKFSTENPILYITIKCHESENKKENNLREELQAISLNIFIFYSVEGKISSAIKF